MYRRRVTRERETFFGDVFDGELFRSCAPQEGADDLQGDRVDTLVHKLAAALALRGDDLVQLLLVKGFVPGEGLLPGHELLQGGLEAVVVKRLDEVVRHAVGVQLADVPASLAAVTMITSARCPRPGV